LRSDSIRVAFTRARLPFVQNDTFRALVLLTLRFFAARTRLPRLRGLRCRLVPVGLLRCAYRYVFVLLPAFTAFHFWFLPLYVRVTFCAVASERLHTFVPALPRIHVYVVCVFAAIRSVGFPGYAYIPCAGWLLLPFYQVSYRLRPRVTPVWTRWFASFTPIVRTVGAVAGLRLLIQFTSVLTFAPQFPGFHTVYLVVTVWLVRLYVGLRAPFGFTPYGCRSFSLRLCLALRRVARLLQLVCTRTLHTYRLPRLRCLFAFSPCRVAFLRLRRLRLLTHVRCCPSQFTFSSIPLTFPTHCHLALVPHLLFDYYVLYACVCTLPTLVGLVVRLLVGCPTRFGC